MQILAFDSATSACSAALWRDGKILARRFEPMARGHSEHLMSMVRAVLAESEATFADLDLLAVTRGPGGFTGLRIGLSAARAMAYAGNLPCLGVSTLEAVAAGVPESERGGNGGAVRGRGRVLAAIDSRRGDVFAQIFCFIEGGVEPEALGAAEAVPPAALENFLKSRADAEGGPGGQVVVVGDAAERAVAALREGGVDAVSSTAPAAPDAGTVAALAAARWPDAAGTEPLRPLYLRSPDAVVPKNGGRIVPGARA